MEGPHMKTIKTLLFTAMLCSALWHTPTHSLTQTDYDNAVAAQPTDCAKLKYLLLYKLINFQIVTQVILGFVKYPGVDWIGFNTLSLSNLNCCDIGFRPEDPTAFPYKVDLSGLEVINGQARGARFDQAILSRARFDGSDLRPGQITETCSSFPAGQGCLNHPPLGCKDSPTSFENTVVPQGSFITFIGTPTNPTRLNNANISNVHWHSTVFKYTDLTNVDFSQSYFHVVIFSGANLTGANFNRARMKSAICDPSNPPIVSNTILADGSVTSSAAKFCRSFNFAYRVGNV